ncbi:sulfurtransferase [Imperialibacter roseus]|uniref:Sulfurtransferase n=1 Tax=Imperialibacter roseus TaxID=1324217 RepID=A0ABZ0ITE4_9BACT|nr:sulfurtransferase [Imperialibacter roseus]WOK08297.1 sulfurtransferase [Imperialibacter roseus]|tara:strand:+ start:9597 stop:10460 length:864 start_codon:yes stop_codon:yes gene_type:complete
MNIKLSPIISAKELQAIYQNDNLVIVDASGGPKARENYSTKHLDRALFADTNKDLANVKPNAAEGGRHPLPTADQFSQALGRLGITPGSHVVVYDDMGGANAAARLWWMLRAIGHSKVQVLDGGLLAAEKAGLVTSSKMEIPGKVAPYPVVEWKLPQADMQEVEKVAKAKDHIVIDVRDAKRYAGLTEPIDLIAGHIPGAINVPFSDNLTGDGLFKSPQALKDKYQAVFGNTPADQVIVHCGSGVTACHLLLAADYAGLDIPKLYVGSWSEWSRNNKEMVTADTAGH